MEIISKVIEMETIFPIDNQELEHRMHQMGLNPLRWSIVGVKDNTLSISLACEN